MTNYDPIHPVQISLKCWIWNKGKTVRKIRKNFLLANINIETEEIKWSLWPILVRLMFRVMADEPEISTKPIKEISDDKFSHILNRNVQKTLNNLKGNK